MQDNIQNDDILDKDDILGRYIWDVLPYKDPNSEEVILLPNNVVNYNLGLELYGSHSLEGIWELEKDTLNLIFEIPPEKIDGNIEVHFEEGKHDKVDLMIMTSEGRDLGGNTIFINGNEHLVYSVTLEIKPQYIDSIKIDFYGQMYEKKIDKYVEGNMKIILTPHQWRNAVYSFIKTKWLAQGHKLIFIDENIIDEEYFLIKVHYGG